MRTSVVDQPKCVTEDAVPRSSRSEVVTGAAPAVLAATLLYAGLAVMIITHAGYPIGVRLAARRRMALLPAATPADLPTLTVVVPAYDEARFIETKLKDTLEQDYPDNLLDVLVVDDGSTDGTADLAEAFAPRVRVLRQATRQGKGAALNAGAAAARGEVVVFTDANGRLQPGSLRAVAGPFADSSVGVVGGNKKPRGAGAHGAGESTYWRLEDGLRRAESAFGAVVGVDGGIYAIRRSSVRPIPPDVYADDYWIPLDALVRGLRVAHAPDACAFESVSANKRDDFERRTRIAAGIWRETLRHPGLLRPANGWVAVAFVCHRVLRTLVVPALLPALLPAAVIAGRHSRTARLIAWLQAVSWAAAATGAVTSALPFALPYQFAMSNAAAVRGGVRECQRRQSSLWKRTERGPWA